METNYIIILNFSVGEVIRIRLDKEQLEESEKYDVFEDYLETLEEKYDFRLKDCQWMITETYLERSFWFLKRLRKGKLPDSKGGFSFFLFLPH